MNKMYYKTLSPLYYREGKIIDARNDNYGLWNDLYCDSPKEVDFILSTAKATDLPISLFYYMITDPFAIELKIQMNNKSTIKLKKIVSYVNYDQDVDVDLITHYLQLSPKNEESILSRYDIWENLGERIRKQYFATMPSRIDSYFLFRDLESARYYINSNNKTDFIIVEVEILQKNVLETFDMSIWDIENNNLPYSECEANIKKYWESNNASEMKYPEVLFQGILKLGAKI